MLKLLLFFGKIVQSFFFRLTSQLSLKKKKKKHYKLKFQYENYTYILILLVSCNNKNKRRRPDLREDKDENHTIIKRTQRQGRRKKKKKRFVREEATVVRFNLSITSSTAQMKGFDVVFINLKKN